MTYSEIVDELQGDKEKAGEFLVKVAIEQQKTLENIKKIEMQLEKANGHYNSTMNEIELVCKHIEIPTTFHIVKDKKYYLFNKNETTITNIDWEL
jgi:hypothetical protein